MVVSEHIPDGLASIKDSWSFLDLVHAHAALDTLDEYHKIAEKEAKNDKNNGHN